jgi:acetyl esterase
VHKGSSVSSPGDLLPGMRALLERIERAAQAPFHQRTAQEARAAYERAAEVLDQPRMALPRVQDLQLPRRDGGVLRARLYSPLAKPVGQAALLYLHGGGFTVGSLQTHESLCRQLAHRSGVDVVALDYRLAPEHRFPLAVDDCFDALLALYRSGPQWGLDPKRLAVGGDSAGGTLAAVCAILARDARIPLQMQLLITPGTTAYADTPSHRRFGKGYLLDARTIEWFFSHYIDHSQRKDWRFAPLNADSLDDVAPAAVLLAECDPLVDEGLAYADRLRMSGVPVQLELVRGVVHDFIKMGRALGQAHLAQDWCAMALRETLLAQID